MKEHKPIEINLHKKSHLLEITFDTGENFKLSCEYLRTHAKSAEVKTATVPIAEKINVNKEFAELFTVLEHGDEITLIPKAK